jgi:hypothetical protein
LKAIRTGRLSRSIGTNPAGSPFVSDVDLALQEWSRNASKAPSSGGGAVSADLAEGQRLLAEQRTRKLRLENDRTERSLLPAAMIAGKAFEATRLLRDTLLSVPARVAADIAAMTDTSVVHHRLDEEIRRALDTAATQLEALDG